MKEKLRKAGLATGMLLVGYAVIASVTNIAMPREAPDETYYPKEGHILASEWERIAQTILKVEDGCFASELTLYAGSEGPPPHFHTTFVESGVVTRGELTVELDGEVRKYTTGERFQIPIGVVHRPFNASSEPVTILSDRDLIPLEFGACLGQFYGFVDRPRAVAGLAPLFQLSLMTEYCDTHMAPLPVEFVLFGALAPVARLMGMESYYPEYRPSQRVEESKQIIARLKTNTP